MEYSLLYVSSLFSILSDDEKDAVIALIETYLSEQQSPAAYTD